MEVVTRQMYLSGQDNASQSDNLFAFKDFFYYIADEHQHQRVDSLLRFRSNTRFTQSTIIRYHNLDPQMRTRNFFLLFENYALMLHLANSTDSSIPFNNRLEQDLFRRFNTFIFQFLLQINTNLTSMLANSPLALIMTEPEIRRDVNSLAEVSYSRQMIRNMNTNFNTDTYPTSISSESPENMTWRMMFHNSRALDDESGTTGSLAGSNISNDRPPDPTELLSRIDVFRNSNFISTGALHGGEWKIDPTLLSEVLLYLFVEKDHIPPARGKYTVELAQFCWPILFIKCIVNI